MAAKELEKEAAGSAKVFEKTLESETMRTDAEMHRSKEEQEAAIHEFHDMCEKWLQSHMDAGFPIGVFVTMSMRDTGMTFKMVNGPGFQLAMKALLESDDLKDYRDEMVKRHVVRVVRGLLDALKGGKVEIHAGLLDALKELLGDKCKTCDQTDCPAHHGGEKPESCTVH